ncbi:MAG: hypothetical protein ABI639_16635 [Thermoanaerobaculia bacterium]
MGNRDVATMIWAATAIAAILLGSGAYFLNRYLRGGGATPRVGAGIGTLLLAACSSVLVTKLANVWLGDDTISRPGPVWRWLPAGVAALAAVVAFLRRLATREANR